MFFKFDMARSWLLASVCLTLLPDLAGGERDLASEKAESWKLQQNWVSLPAIKPIAANAADGLNLGVEPGLEAKWSCELNLPLRNFNRLELDYVAQNFNAAPGEDFFIHLETDSVKPAKRYLVKRDEVNADGQKHRLVFDLDSEFPGATQVRRMIIHVLGRPDVSQNAVVNITRLKFSGPDTPAMDNTVAPPAKRLGEVGFELTADNLKKLKSHPTWCSGLAAQTYDFKFVNGRFVIQTDGGEMKWSLPLSVATDEYGYLTLTYRTNNFNPAPGEDFFLHLDTSAMGASKKGYAVARDALIADGKWHTVTVNLKDVYGEGSVNQLVFHLVPIQDGPVQVELSELFFSSESGVASVGQSAKLLSEVRFSQNVKVIRRDPAEVTWPYGDPQATAQKADNRITFAVPAAGAVMRWNCILPSPVPLHPGQIMEMRYRAENLEENPDGVVFLGWNVVNDSVPENMKPLKFNRFVSDGLWHVVRAEVPAGVDSAWTVAVMPRTNAGGEGKLEIDYLRFYDAIPENRLEQSIEVTPVASLPKGFAAVALPQAAEPISVLRKYFTPESFPSPGKYNIAGIPFEIGAKLYGTKLKGAGQLEIALANQNATEIFLLLGSRFSGNNSPAISRGRLSAVAEVERFLGEIVYSDGTTEEVFPANYRNGKHILQEGLEVYAIKPSFAKPVKELKLKEWMENGAFYLAAVTVNQNATGKLPAAWHAAPPYFSSNVAAAPKLTPTQIDLKKLTVSNSYLQLSLDPQNPLVIRSLVNRITGETLIDAKSDATLLRLSQPLTVKQTSMAGETLVLEVASEHYQGKVLISPAPDFGQIQVAAEITYCGPGETVSAAFPSLTQIALNQTSWWFYPKLGLSAGRSNIEFTGRYGGIFPFQIMGFFTPERGGGFYLQGLDDKNIAKDFCLSRSGVRGSLKIVSCPVLLQKNQLLPLAPYVLGANVGGYRQQAQIYKHFLDGKKWVRTPVKNWLRERFMLYEIYAHHGYYQVFDVKSSKFLLEPTIRLLNERFGGVDMFHFFDFGLTKNNGRVGDYDYSGMLGAPGEFENFLATADKKYHIPTSLYVEGNLAAKNSEFIKKSGDAGQRISMSGEKLLYPGTTEEMFMCPEYKPWQEHLNQLAGELLKKTGAKAIYLDEFGYGGPDRVCYAANHGHPVPGYAIPGEMQILSKISATLKAIDPEYAILSEASPNDINMQYQDGSLSSAVSEYRESGNFARVDLYRYFFPEYKSFQIIALHDLIGDGYTPYKLVWFNASGLMLTGDPEADYSENTCNFLRFMNASYRANKEYFSSDKVDFDLPYGAPGVFVNQFGGKKGKLYTLFNANYRTAQGVVMRIALENGAPYFVRDLFGKPLKATPVGGYLEIESTVPPRGVNGVVVEQ